jgi:hypothetical protein
LLRLAGLLASVPEVFRGRASFALNGPAHGSCSLLDVPSPSDRAPAPSPFPPLRVVRHIVDLAAGDGGPPGLERFLQFINDVLLGPNIAALEAATRLYQDLLHPLPTAVGTEIVLERLVDPALALLRSERLLAIVLRVLPGRPDGDRLHIWEATLHLLARQPTAPSELIDDLLTGLTAGTGAVTLARGVYWRLHPAQRVAVWAEAARRGVAPAAVRHTEIFLGCLSREVCAHPDFDRARMFEDLALLLEAGAPPTARPGSAALRQFVLFRGTVEPLVTKEITDFLVARVLARAPRADLTGELRSLVGDPGFRVSDHTRRALVAAVVALHTRDVLDLESLFSIPQDSEGRAQVAGFHRVLATAEDLPDRARHLAAAWAEFLETVSRLTADGYATWERLPHVPTYAEWAQEERACTERGVKHRNTRTIVVSLHPQIRAQVWAIERPLAAAILGAVYLAHHSRHPPLVDAALERAALVPWSQESLPAPMQLRADVLAELAAAAGAVGVESDLGPLFARIDLETECGANLARRIDRVFEEFNHRCEPWLKFRRSTGLFGRLFHRGKTT